MEDSFVDLLHSLTNEKVDTVRLAELSDLDAERLDGFALTWQDLSPGRRHALLEDLGSLSNEKIELTFEAINRVALDDSDPAVRQQAIENLWESEDPALVGSLINLLNDDPVPEVRGAAGKALGVYVFIVETREFDPGIQLRLEEALLLAARSDVNDVVRDLCLRSLGYSSRPEVPALIEGAYATQDEFRVASALRAMAHSANASWGEHVMAHLHDGFPIIRLEAVRAAGQIELNEGVPDLIELLEDVDVSIRRAAMWSLGQIGGSRASETLNSLAEQEMDEIEQATLHDAIDNLAFGEGALDLFSLDQNDPPDLLD